MHILSLACTMSFLHPLYIVAYHTLKECSQQKVGLTEKIELTNEKIKAKRKELERLREELKILGTFFLGGGGRERERALGFKNSLHALPPLYIPSSSLPPSLSLSLSLPPPGEEELLLKRKRDASYTTCADVKKRLKCSQDALKQLAVLAPAKNSGSNTVEGGTVGEGQSLRT